MEKAYMADVSVPRFVEAPFLPSKIHNARVVLIKVPKFVANIWEEAAHKSVVGVITNDPQKGSEELVVYDPSKAKQISFLDSKKKTNSNLYVIQPKKKNNRHADICAAVDSLTAFVPRFDPEYQEMLKKRHQESTLCRGRSTTEEKRKEAYDANRTLFQYYNPRQRDSLGNLMNFDGAANAAGAFDGIMSQRAAKSKQKKMLTMTADTLRMRIFQLFENAGEEGLTLKRLAVDVDQPLNFVKTVLEEVGEQRRRASDRRLVYFLRDQFLKPGTQEGLEEGNKKMRLS